MVEFLETDRFRTNREMMVGRKGNGAGDPGIEYISSASGFSSIHPTQNGFLE